MCGIAGLMHRGRTADVGREMTAMLQSLKHRGPDSTGFAVYGTPNKRELVVRVKIAEHTEFKDGIDLKKTLIARREEAEARMRELGVNILKTEQPTDYALLYRINYAGDLRQLSTHVEGVEGVEIMSIGHALELIKDLGDANTVAGNFGLKKFKGTHAIGHTRMATESDVDICSAHPYWAFPYRDISVVHNGQLTNYWSKRRDLERVGQRFVSNCDSELIAVYLAHKIEHGATLEGAMRDSITELDGVFTYLVATADSLGMAKDTMAAKPMVLYESPNCVALASEEVAIREIIPHEIDTCDPYEGEVRVWKK